MNMRFALPCAFLLLAACAAMPPTPLPLAESVDLPRFMGDWHVIAATPTLLDRDAYGAIESYRLESDGTVATTYTFRDGANGPQRRHTPRGFVRDASGNAVWGMQFVWPIKADYRIAWLAPDYSQVIVAREARDYAWIMAREPRIPEEDLRRHIAFLVSHGYDTATIRRVPQP